MVINCRLDFTPGQQVKCPQSITWSGRSTAAGLNNILMTMPSTVKVMCLWDIFRKGCDASLVLIVDNSHNRTIDGWMTFNRKFPEQTPIIGGLSSKQDGKCNPRHICICGRCVGRKKSIHSELDMSCIGLHYLLLCLQIILKIKHYKCNNKT
jgi:hypothetical protein